MIPDNMQPNPLPKEEVTIVPCPDCGSKNVIVVSYLWYTSHGWSVHTTTHPLWQCRDCKRVYMRNPKEEEYESPCEYPDVNYD